MASTREWSWRLALSALALAPRPAFAGEVWVYITDSGGDSIEAIYPATNKVEHVITGVEVPHGINFSPDGSRLYASNEAKHELDVIDRKSAKIIAEVALSGHPNNIAVSKDGGRVFVAINAGRGVLDVVDTAALRLAKSIPVNGPLHNVYVTPDGKYAVAGSVQGQILTAIDLQTERPAWEVRFKAGVRPMAVEANTDGSTGRVFVELSKFHGFAVVDFAKHQEVARIRLPNQQDARNNGEITPCHGIAVAPDGKTLWVTSIPNNAVYVYSLEDLKLVGEVALPSLKLRGHEAISAVANWVTFTPDSRTIYISNAGLRSVSAIDARSMKLVAVIPVGEVPKRINTLNIVEPQRGAATSRGNRASLH
jgi:YVTN family beta-propeller protein